MRRTIAEGEKKKPKRLARPDQIAFLATEPDCDNGTRLLARAFVQMASCRQIGMSLGPIPWTVMVQWCDHHGLPIEITNHVITVVSHIDAIMIRRANSKKPSAPTEPRTRGRKG